MQIKKQKHKLKKENYINEIQNLKGKAYGFEGQMKSYKNDK